MKKLILLITFTCTSYVLNAQLSTRELPPSFINNIENLHTSPENTKVLPKFDLQKLRIEDEIDENAGIPPRFGYKQKVDFSIENSGEWTTLPNGDKLWRLQIKSPGALSINLLYKKYWLPKQGKLFIYSADRQYSIGAFTSVNNKSSKNKIQGFATGLVYSNNIIVEYYQPKNVIEQAIISIEYVVHGYRYINIEGNKALGGSGNCQVNINCTEGDDWQNEKNAIALILVDGNRYCTGSLINTTAEDLRPYILTADHCLGGWANDFTKYDAITNPDLDHYSFYWHYEHPDCSNSTNEPAIYSTTGATVIANNSISDFALLELNENPIDNPNIITYYLGWDRSGNAGHGGVGIHHPSGDVKKIANYDITPNSSNCFNTGNAYFWKVNWSSTINGFSVTEGGSSGSPLINNNHKLIGQLYGSAYCPNPNCSDPSSDIANYGKFSISWTGNNASDNRRRLDHWLDSSGTGVTTLNGFPSISGTSTLCSFGDYDYIINNLPTEWNVIWTKSNNLAYVSQTANSYTVQPIRNTTYPSDWIEATISSIYSDDITIRKNVYLSPVMSDLEITVPSEPINGNYDALIWASGLPSEITNYNWTITNGYIVSEDGNSVTIGTNCCIRNKPIPILVDVTAQNSCGTSFASKSISVTCDGMVNPLSVSPNPANEFIDILFEEDNKSELIDQEKIHIKVYNSQSVPVFNVITKQKKFKLNTSSYPDGLYFIHVQYKNKKFIKTVLISH